MSQENIGTAVKKLSELLRLAWCLEMDNELNKVREERDRLQAQCEELRSDQKTLQEVCVAGRQRITELQDGLVRDVSHYIEAAEVDRPTEPQPAEPQQHPAEYTPPEGWRLLEVGEEVDIPGRDQYVLEVHRYIRRIEQQPQPQPVQVCEGRWKTRNGEVRNVTPRPEGDGREERFPWWDAAYRQTWRANGRYHFGEEGPLDLVTYLGAIEEEQEFKPYTFAAYIVGDKSQPDALRIVWATEEWIQHANFGIVHRMKDMQFFGNDGCNVTGYHGTLALNLKVQ